MRIFYSRHIKQVVPILGATFLLSCASTSKQPSVAPAPIDITTLNGEGPKAQMGCSDNALYRYAARTNGPNARLDEFCIQEEYQEKFVHQPTSDMM